MNSIHAHRGTCDRIANRLAHLADSLVVVGMEKLADELYTMSEEIAGGLLLLTFKGHLK